MDGNIIDIGSEATYNLTNPERLVWGAILAFAGVILLIFVMLPEYLLPDQIAWISVAIMVVGIMFAVTAWTQSMDTIYMKNNRCQIVDGDIECHGRCTQCVFAAEYVRSVRLEHDHCYISEDDE